MAKITIALSDEQVTKLNELADQFGISVDDLICASVDEMLERPATRFEQAVDYVLKKNAALYRKLAE